MKDGNGARGMFDAERNINKYKENKCMPEPETLKVYEIRVAAKVSLFFLQFFFFVLHSISFFSLSGPAGRHIKQSGGQGAGHMCVAFGV